MTWESGESLDFGVDFSFFKGRLYGTAEYFNRKTTGLIFDVPQPWQNGGSTGGGFTIPTNIGEMLNKGVELSLSGVPVRTKDFQWTVTLNATSFTNRITKMPPTVPFIIDGTKRLEAGRSIYDYFLRDFYGVDPTDGAVLYRADLQDAANIIIPGRDGKNDTLTKSLANARLMYVNKTSIPDVYGSIVNGFSFKDFEFSFVLTYQIGGYTYDAGYAGLMHPGIYGENLHKDALLRWQAAGDVTQVPRMDNERNSVFNAQSDRWLLSATHLNINNLNFAYNLPKSILGKINAQNARVYVSAENVALFAKRRGTYVNQNFSGVTATTYPPARIITAGVALTF